MTNSVLSKDSSGLFNTMFEVPDLKRNQVTGGAIEELEKLKAVVSIFEPIPKAKPKREPREMKYKHLSFLEGQRTVEATCQVCGSKFQKWIRLVGMHDFCSPECLEASGVYDD